MDLATLTLQEFTAGFNDGMSSNLPQGSGMTAKSPLRRCRTREQGIALMTVSHAIEYLVDTRLIKQQTTSSAELEALAILQIANLNVYREGTEIVPLASRLRQWFRGGSVKSKTADATA